MEEDLWDSMPENNMLRHLYAAWRVRQALREEKRWLIRNYTMLHAVWLKFPVSYKKRV